MASQLVALPAVERLSPRCIRILGGNPGKFTLQGTNTYLLGTGKQRILIDTGEGRPIWVSSLREVLEKEKATIGSALISHWHPDHVGGIRDLVGVSPGTVVYKNKPDLGQSEIIDGQVFRVEGATLTASYTPGHSVDHMVFQLAEEDALFTADNVLGQGTAIFEDLTTYLASLSKMRTLFKGRAYPGHGPVVDDGPGKITEYIEHRQQREEQIVSTLRSAENGKVVNLGALDIVKKIYTDIPETLHMAARSGVMQVLEKLEKEGKVVRNGDDSWRLGRSPSL
ncbi:Flavorubredoxin [Geosmithia morbida]|uniref:Flavorubredoxin n=1 Tax=Geosmithia morbida TaxID=1094350 RepID=A0A9P5D4L0_9HYPO|nr:Flavorubredoxin [Geosmithia morbida]KAF4121594.1 Flavorubredoxin [Geosmithia morbida]